MFGTLVLRFVWDTRVTNKSFREEWQGGALLLDTKAYHKAVDVSEVATVLRTYRSIEKKRNSETNLSPNQNLGWLEMATQIVLSSNLEMK